MIGTSKLWSILLRLNCRGVGSFSFRLPPWTRTAVDTAAKSLRYNVINLTASTTPKLATVSVVLQGSVKVAGEPPAAKQSRGGKELSNTNGQDNIQSKSSQLRKHEQQPQTQQSPSKKMQPQAQESSSKKKQPKPQQSPSKKEQLQKQQTQKHQTQNQQPQSKKPRPQNSK